MSNRDKIVALLKEVLDYKTSYILAYIQGITIDEEIDDIFCERMVQNYLNDPNPNKDETYTLNECKKEWGID